MALAEVHGPARYHPNLQIIQVPNSYQNRQKQRLLIPTFHKVLGYFMVIKLYENHHKELTPKLTIYI
jgi:hypothetical protein